MFIIKKASKEDIPLIRQLTMQVWPQTYVPIIGEQQTGYMLGLYYTPASLQKQMETEHHQFIICYNDEQPVAFASYSEIETRIFKLHKIYILPDRQGTGIGHYMMKHIVAAIKQLGATELRLNVNRYNLAARDFYEKAGFQHIRDEDIDIGGGYFMNDHVLSLFIQ